MYSIQLSDALRNGLATVALKRGESLESFVSNLLETFLTIFETEQPKSLRQALIDARKKIDASNTPLIHTWDELEAELADRRGGFYQE